MDRLTWDVDDSSILAYPVSACELMRRAAVDHVAGVYADAIAKAHEHVRASLVACPMGGAGVMREETHGGIYVGKDNWMLGRLCLALGWDEETDALADFALGVKREHGTLPVALDRSGAPAGNRQWEPAVDANGNVIAETQSLVLGTTFMGEHGAIAADARTATAGRQLRATIGAGGASVERAHFLTALGAPVYVAGDGRISTAGTWADDLAPPGEAVRGVDWQHITVNGKALEAAAAMTREGYWRFYGNNVVTLADMPALPRPSGGFVLHESSRAIRVGAQMLERADVSPATKVQALARAVAHVEAIRGFGNNPVGMAFGVRNPREALFAREVSRQEQMLPGQALMYGATPIAVYDLRYLARSAASFCPAAAALCDQTAATLARRIAGVILKWGWTGWVAE